MSKITIDREFLMQVLEVLQAPVKTVNTEAMKSKASAALCEALAQQDSVAWEHHAKKLTQWRHCMSYNDSYFGEPVGLVKQVTCELDRLIGTSPTASTVTSEDARLARKPLTNEQIYMHCPNWLSQEQCKTWVRQIEAAHGIKEMP